MFGKRRKVSFSDLSEAAASADPTMELHYVWRALQRSLMPEGGTVEALQLSDGRWVGTLRIAGEKIASAEAPTAILAMMRTLLPLELEPDARLKRVKGGVESGRLRSVEAVASEGR
jgi:hypothetical protein